VYNSLLLIFLSENPRAELKPVIFTKLVAETRNEIIHKTVVLHYQKPLTNDKIFQKN